MSLAITASATLADRHEHDITSLLFVHGRLYSGSDDGKIKIWSPDLELKGQTQAHPCSVYSLASDPASDLLYSCSNDGTVQMWGLSDLGGRGPLVVSEREFWKVHFDQGRLYVVNDQGTISIYKDNRIQGTIETLEQIKDLASLGRLVFTVRDLDLVIQEVMGDNGRTMTCRTLAGRAPLCLAADKLCYSSRDGMGVLVNYNNKEIRFQSVTEIKNAHEKLINALTARECDDGVQLYSGGWDCVVKQWLIGRDGGHVAGPTCATPTQVTTLCLGNEGHLYAGGEQGQIWKVTHVK